MLPQMVLPDSRHRRLQRLPEFEVDPVFQRLLPLGLRHLPLRGRQIHTVEFAHAGAHPLIALPSHLLEDRRHLITGGGIGTSRLGQERIEALERRDGDGANHGSTSRRGAAAATVWRYG
jgi:hypothetical protein